MDYEKMTEEILKRRDEIRRQKKRETTRFLSAALVTCILGICIGGGIHFATKEKSNGVGEQPEKIILYQNTTDANEFWAETYLSFIDRGYNELFAMHYANSECMLSFPSHISLKTIEEMQNIYTEAGGTK